MAGSTRYDASYKLHARDGKSWGTTAIVATGEHFADALAAGPLAGRNKAAMLLAADPIADKPNMKQP